jgi:lipase
MDALQIDPTSHGFSVLPDSRQPVLALHAAAGSGRQWQGLSDYLRGRYRVIAPDLPGYGSARWFAARDIEDVADRIVRTIGIGEPMHVVGHAHGAAVALELAMTRPDLVRSLSLIEPAVFHLLRTGSASDQALFGELASLAEWMAASVAADNPTAGMRAYVDYWYGPGAWYQTSSGLRESLTRQTERVALDLAASLAETWPATQCSGLDCPTLAVMALESPTASLRVTEIVADAIPGARLLMVPDAGYMAPLTDPHIIDPLIGGHLRSVDRSEPELSSWDRAA